jgi:hypothetical protein
MDNTNSKPKQYVAIQQTYKVSTNFDVMPPKPPRIRQTKK